MNTFDMILEFCMSWYWVSVFVIGIIAVFVLVWYFASGTYEWLWKYCDEHVKYRDDRTFYKTLIVIGLIILTAGVAFSGLYGFPFWISASLAWYLSNKSRNNNVIDNLTKDS